QGSGPPSGTQADERLKECASTRPNTSVTGDVWGVRRPELTPESSRGNGFIGTRHANVRSYLNDATVSSGGPRSPVGASSNRGVRIVDIVSTACRRMDRGGVASRPGT